jgi:hypothetical protein
VAIDNDPLIGESSWKGIFALTSPRRWRSWVDVRFDAVEKILPDAEADFAAEHVTPSDVVGDWLLSLAVGRRTSA